MKTKWWYIWVIALVLLSLGLFCTQVVFFQRSSDTLFYLFQDLAFLPIQVLLVSLILNGWLSRREKRQLLNKMNMVIGVFFAEMGHDLLRRLLPFAVQVDPLCQLLRIEPDWTEAKWREVRRQVAAIPVDIDSRHSDLAALKSFLVGKKSFMLQLLSNQNLLEHQCFTDLLWAVSHLAEELHFRNDFSLLPASDLAHLSLDMCRAFSLLLLAWLEYLLHLRIAYPYIFSLVLRTNPFVPDARPEVFIAPNS